jgi:hypothetical protein
VEDQPTEKRLALGLLICGLVLGATLLLIRSGAQNTLSHDDVISYLAATGHMGAYATEIPAGRWVPAQAWQAYWMPDRFGVFGQIGRDLARYDIHPPLYFWLLHIWIQVTGVRLSAGPLLNTAFLLLGAWIIARACRLARCSRGASALAAVMWLLSGATLAVAGETRQYSLLGLAVAGLTASLLLFLDRRSLAAALLVYATAAAGLLVHYQFAVLLSLGTLVAAILLMRGRLWRGVVLLFAAMAAAGITFLLLHPGFTGSFAMQRSQAIPFAWTDIPYRMTRVLYALFEQVMLPRMAWALGDAASRYWGIFLLMALAACLAVWLVARRRAGGGKVSRADGEAFLLIFTAAALLLVAFLYIFQISPRHAMGAQYLMAVSPLLFMTGARVFDRLAGGIRWRPVLILALVVYQGAYGGWMTFAQVRTASERPPAASDSGSPILLDSVARGVLPTVLWHVPASTPVYAAMQDDLLDGFPEIPADVRRLVYVSDLRYGNNADKQSRVLEQLAAQGFRSVAERGSVNGMGETFEVIR